MSRPMLMRAAFFLSWCSQLPVRRRAPRMDLPPPQGRNFTNSDFDNAVWPTLIFRFGCAR